MPSAGLPPSPPPLGHTIVVWSWPDLIDVDAGRIASGRSTVEEVGWELFHDYLDVASGRKKTWTEAHRIHNDLALFNPAPLT